MKINIIGPGAKLLYPKGNILWQDYPAKIHQARVSLDAAQQNLRHRLDYVRQASKMADVWTIGNVWVVLKAEFKVVDPQIKEELRISIKKLWALMAKNEDLCKKPIGSIPAKLQAVIKKERPVSCKGRLPVKYCYIHTTLL